MSRSSRGLRVGVLGAGAIGTFLGGRLASAGASVTLVGRPRVLDPIAERGLVVEDLEGEPRRLAPDALRVAHDPAALGDAEVVLVTTKIGDTEAAARAVSAATAPEVPVVSVQNGVDGPATLGRVLGPSRAYGGMIAYNVVFRDATTLRRATTGPLVIEHGPPVVRDLVRTLRAAGLETLESSEMPRVLWTKLLFNLNNALNALSGLPLRAQLRDREYRRLMATMMREGLAVMQARGLRPTRFGALYPPLVARILPVPDVVFERVARAMLAIDPAARSSMADDLALGRKTEIDALNGAVVRSGREQGVPTPVNARVVEAIHAAETAGKGSPGLSAARIAAGA